MEATTLTNETDADTIKIRALNDAHRKQMRCMTTPGIRGYHPIAIAAILGKVRDFDQFNDANDPYGEHDFGSFDFDGETIMWQIDYYDPTMEYGSEDPADPVKTNRVLTIMTAMER